MLIKDSRGGIPLQRAEKSQRIAVIEYLKPLTLTESPPEEQFTEGKEATKWG